MPDLDDPQVRQSTPSTLVVATTGVAVVVGLLLALMVGPLVRVHLWIVTLLCSGLALGKAVEAGHPFVAALAFAGAAVTAVGPVGPRWSSIRAWLVVLIVLAADVAVLVVLRGAMPV